MNIEDEDWKFLTGDVNWEEYGGKFVLRVAKRRFFIIDVLNWYETVGEDEATCEFNVSLDECDVSVLSEKNKEDLLSSCGWEGADRTDPLVWAEMMHSYGMKAPLWGEDGDDIEELMEEAKSAAAELLDDPSLHAEYLQTPVNAIGSTAMEFMKGDLTSAMDRALAQETEMVSMGPGMKPVFTMRVDFDFVRRQGISEDPMAFTYGYMHGQAGTGMDEGEGELASEYVRGHRLGVEVAAGREEQPMWHKGA